MLSIHDQTKFVFANYFLYYVQHTDVSFPVLSRGNIYFLLETPENDSEIQTFLSNWKI